MIQMSHESHECANWSINDTNLLLDLILQQKNLCHWSARNPTKLGWANITHGFYAQSNSRYTSKQMQNKWHDLRRSYFNWRKGVNKSGLGRDPETGEVTYDPVLYAASTNTVKTKTFCHHVRSLVRSSLHAY
jgi:hypothetical protein